MAMNKTTGLIILTVTVLITLWAPMCSQKTSVAGRAEGIVATLTETDGETVLKESVETGDSYFITLKREPTADVIVSLTFDSAQIQIGSEQTGMYQLIFT